MLTIFAGFLLRAAFVHYAALVTIDSKVYADIAQNWLSYHTYSISDDATVRPTLVRLPGYPSFLAAIFFVFGHGNFSAVLWVQVFIDLFTCLLIADIARRTIGDKAFKPALLLSALCPFTSNYVALPLTETLAIFCTAAAIDLAIVAIAAKSHRHWLYCGGVIAFAILLRPDSGLLLGSIGLYLIYRIARIPAERRHVMIAGVLLTVVSLSPLVPWTIRNWRTYHVFQPLVTMDASDPGEFEPGGWRRWLSNWLYDYVSEEDLLFKVSGEEINFSQVPERAFANPQQRARVQDLFERYNKTLEMTPELDQEFADLAKEYAHLHPVRAYLVAPVVRLADMWLRPRVEMLDIDTRWWEYQNDPTSFWYALGFGALNLAFLGLAAYGLWRGARVEYLGLLLTYIVVRSIFMMYTGTAEPRYLLECYPMIFVLGAPALVHCRHKAQRANELAQGPFQ